MLDAIKPLLESGLYRDWETSMALKIGRAHV